MDIQPLCPELIAKLEIAVAHRNRERAISVIDGHFAKLDTANEKSINTPLADLLPTRYASILEREGYLTVRDLKGVTEQELSKLNGVGAKFLCVVKANLSEHINITTTNHSKSASKNQQ
jgi:DNA-directed RNA polymerase alpha subunit